MKKKKLMSLFVLGCGALLLAGCGTDSKKEDNDEKEKKVTTQTLKCSVEQADEEGIVTTAETEFVYDKEKKKLVSGTMSMILDYTKSLKDVSEDEKEQTETLIESMLGSMCDTFEDEGYKNCKSEFKNSKFDMTMEFDMDKLEETTDGDVNVDMTLDELKEYFEDSEGTKCTIE